ncbi:MAG TPA: NADH-quinone oxidoreductase subunit N [Myxococcota bacterium]|nr:NADH-quinone oxidoreductase subunit N [Myxococcota bacterium]HQK51025.1 NADH-quinone oxidoreductase subunit N [Myxococcota bacterium]
MKDLVAISPLWVSALTGLVAMALDLLTGSGRKSFLAWVVAIGLSLSAALGLALWRDPVILSFPSLVAVLHLDFHGAFFGALVALFGALAALLAVPHLPEQGIDEGETDALLAFSAFGGQLLVVAVDLITLFLGLEVLSLSLYVLAASRRSSPFGAEAGLKYFLLGGVASGLLLLAAAFLYGATGSLDLRTILDRLLAGSGGTDPTLAALALVLILVALGFKVAAVPFHFWTPDVYQGSPPPVTGYMAGAVKAAAFAVLARLLLTLWEVPAVAALGSRDVLLWLGILSVVVGSVLGVVQDDARRILAWSSIVHAGYLLLGLWAVEPREGIGGLWTLNGSVPFYLLAYGIASLGAFGALGVFARGGHEDYRLARLAGLGRGHPAATFVLMASVLSLAGMPPLGGFLAKFRLFQHVVAVDSPWSIPAVVIAVLASVVSLYYYLRILKVLYFDEPSEETAGHASSPAAAFAMAATVVASLVLGIVPTPFLDAGRRAAQGTVLAAGASLERVAAVATPSPAPVSAPVRFGEGVVPPDARRPAPPVPVQVIRDAVGGYRPPEAPLDQERRRAPDGARLMEVFRSPKARP